MKKDFSLVNLHMTDKAVELKWTATVEGNDGKMEKATFTKTSAVMPHPDFVKVKNSFKEYLLRAHGHYKVYEMADKYLKGQQR